MALPTDPQFDSLPQKFKDDLMARSYESLLYTWRFAPVGSTIFQGIEGEFYSAVMFAKKSELPDNGVQASKNVGWDK